LSFIYGGVVQIYRWMYEVGLLKAKRFPAVVISVGNLTVGGTGKTPLVREIAEHLLSDGQRPVILARGYRNVGRGSVIATAENWRLAGDEASMLAWLVPEAPVIVDPHRERAARLAVERYRATHLILDDGFQYWRVRKDTDIVLLNAERPYGNGWVFPAGSLREFSGNLRRATRVVATGEGSESDLLPKPHFRARHLPDCLLTADGGRESFGAWQQCEFETLSGVGDSASFARTLRAAGLGLCIRKTILPDHCAYTEFFLRKQMPSLFEEKGPLILTTAKDLVKLRSLRLPASGRMRALLTRFTLQNGSLADLSMGGSS
jgi:tetraacyldisaccharide 4'-kinase